MNIRLIEKIEKLGLQHNEARVYVGLLELGAATVTTLAKYAQLKRTSLYDILHRLEVLSLITTAEAKKGVYIPEHPQAFIRFLETRKRSAERAMTEGETVRKTLEGLYKIDLKPSVKVVHSKGDMESLYNHALDAKGEIYSILNLAGYAEIFDELGKFQSAQRARAGIRQRVLAIDNTVARKWYHDTYDGDAKRKQFTTYQWIEADEKNLPSGEILFFDDKIIAMLSSADEHITYEIQSKSFAGFLKIIFERAWEST